MIRYVDIDAFEEELCKETADYSELEQVSGADYSWIWRKKFYEVFETFPAADVAEIKHGKWIMHINDLFPTESTMECNQCHEEQPLECDDKYCPNCGALMMDEEENIPMEYFENGGI